MNRTLPSSLWSFAVRAFAPPQIEFGKYAAAGIEQGATLRRRLYSEYRDQVAVVWLTRPFERAGAPHFFRGAQANWRFAQPKARQKRARRSLPPKLIWRFAVEGQGPPRRGSRNRVRITPKAPLRSAETRCGAEIFYASVTRGEPSGQP